MPLPDPVTSATLPCSDGTTDEQSVRRASTDVAASGERAARRIGSSLASAGLAVWGRALPADTPTTYETRVEGNCQRTITGQTKRL